MRAGRLNEPGKFGTARCGWGRIRGAVRRKEGGERVITQAAAPRLVRIGTAGRISAAFEGGSEIRVGVARRNRPDCRAVCALCGNFRARHQPKE